MRNDLLAGIEGARTIGGVETMNDQCCRKSCLLDIAAAQHYPWDSDLDTFCRSQRSSTDAILQQRVVNMPNSPGLARSAKRNLRMETVPDLVCNWVAGHRCNPFD
jgi:hypothetical protein